MATIEVKGIDELTRKLEKLNKLDGLKPAVRAAAIHAKGKMAVYPPRKKVTIQQIGGWASEKQRRWFFWALRSGAIEVPYRRGQSPGSEDIADKWTTAQPTLSDGGLTAKVGINVSYAHYVQGDGTQSRMMKMIGWKTDKTVLDENEQAIKDIIADGIKDIINA